VRYIDSIGLFRVKNAGGTGILRQNPEKIAETSSGEVSPLNWSGFHTVWLNFAHMRIRA
jgi:hypothetical protein